MLLIVNVAVSLFAGKIKSSVKFNLYSANFAIFKPVKLLVIAVPLCVKLKSKEVMAESPKFLNETFGLRT